MDHNVNYVVNGNCFIPIKRQQSKFKEQSEISCLLDNFGEVSALQKSGKGLKKVRCTFYRVSSTKFNTYLNEQTCSIKYLLHHRLKNFQYSNKAGSPERKRQLFLVSPDNQSKR